MTTIQPIGIPTLHAGCKAYIDTLKGLVPCVVVCVVEPGNGWEAVSGRIRVLVTTSTGAWPLGHVGEFPACRVVPQSHVSRPGIHYRIDTKYRWV